MEKTQSGITPVSRRLASVRFIIGSLLGIVLFFIKLPIGGKRILIVDLITSKAQGVIIQFPLAVALISGAYVLYRLYRIKFWKASPFEVFLHILSLFAIALLICDAIGCMPEFFISNGVYEKSLMTCTKFCSVIAVIMFFLPPLINYGLPEAVGVFARPLTRPVFCLPGRSAVIVISAFMGNFTVGHFQTNELYTSGKINYKEAAIIATGFCTSSIGLIISIINTAGQMERFTLIFFLIFLATLAITAITAHIYPLRKYSTDYYEGVQAEPERYEKGNMFKTAYNCGVDVCVNTKPIPEQCIRFGLKTLPSVANLYICGIGCLITFTLLNMYTPILKWIGLLFYPFIKLVGLKDVGLIASALGMNAIDNSVAQLNLVTAAGASSSTIMFGCGFGIMTVIFFGAFLASLYSTKIKIKFFDLLLLWFERTALTVVIWGLIARLLA